MGSIGVPMGSFKVPMGSLKFPWELCIVPMGRKKFPSELHSSHGNFKTSHGNTHISHGNYGFPKGTIVFPMGTSLLNSSYPLSGCNTQVNTHVFSQYTMNPYSCRKNFSNIFTHKKVRFANSGMANLSRDVF